MSEDAITYRPGRIIAGRYRITSPLSKGGMGAVYLAQQVSLGRDVALKVILERGSDPELIKRFDIEARAVCQLKHPNIITYHDYGRDEEGHPFLVMEFLAGYPGSKLVYGERRPTLSDLVHVVAQVCSALHEAHQKGIIHRDLKWSNIMVCPQSHDPYFAKLIDFGIMKVATDGSSGDQRAMTRTGMLLGTPEYMSPEAICGMPIDGRADQYSLAIMLWEALEGHRPYEAASHFELLRQQVQEALPPFSAAAGLMAEFPLLEGVLARAAEKHPDDRFDSILEFQQALLQAIGKGDASRPATTPARPGAQARVSAGPGSGRASSRELASGMPPPSRRSRLPVEEPAPLDTRVKTGRQAIEKARRGPHWAWFAVGFLALAGGGFGAVLVATGKGDAPEIGDAGGGDVSAADAKVASGPDAATANGERVALAGDVGPGEKKALEASADATGAKAPVDTEPARADTAQAVADTATADSAQVAASDAGPTAEVAAGEVAKAEVAPGEVTPGEVAKANPEAPKPTAPGHLSIRVQPWGNVSIDGKAPGRDFSGPVKPGLHTVTITNPFYKGSYSFKIKVESGKPTSRLVNLEDVLEKAN